MIITCLFVAAAALGQTTQPADRPVGPGNDSTPPAVAPAPANPARGASVGRAPAPRITVAVPTTRPQSMADVPVKITPATQPTGTSPGQLSGDTVNIQSTDNGIFVQGNPQDIAFLRSIIEALEQRAPAKFEIVRLTTASATELASNLQQIWDKAKTINGRVPPEDKLTVIPESRSNSLVIATSPENIAEVTRLINELDTSFGGKVSFVPIQLKNIKAAEAEKIIQDLLSTLGKQRKLDAQLANIKIDVRTNRLLVAAPEADLKMIEHLVELIDVAPSEEGGGVAKAAIFPLLKAIARDLAPVLTEMLQANTDAGKVAQEQIRRLQVVLQKPDGEKALPDLDLEKPIKIQADATSNSLVVQSTESNLKAIAELIKVMDTTPIGEDMMVKIFPLKYAEASALQTNLQDMFTQGTKLPQQPNQPARGAVPPDLAGAAMVYNIGLSADKRTNTLIVSGRPEQVLLVQQVINAVDVSESANRFPVRKIDLKYADVKRIQQAVEELRKMRDQIAQRLGPMEQERERIVVIPDERTKSLIVIAKDDNFAEVQDLVSKLDSASDKWEGEIHIISLQPPLTATDVADKVKAIWERRNEQRRQSQLPDDKPVLVADTRSNAVVVAANPEDLAAIIKLVGQLQQLPLSPMQDIREIVLKHNDATKLEGIINNVFDKRLSQSSGDGKVQPADKVSVVAEPLTNTLLIASSKAMYDEVVRLVNQLDVQPLVEGSIRTFFVRNIDSTQAATMLRDLFKTGVYRGPGPQAVPESQKNVTILQDVRSNALIVSGSPENLNIVESILKDVDRVEVPAFQEDTRIIALRNADVTQVADQLTQLMDGIRKALGDAGTQFQLTIIPNARTNSLILAGSRVAMRRAAEIVPSLDQVSERAAYETHVYKLRQGSATQLEPMLTSFFKDRLPATETKQRTPLVIIPDEASNSLIISAPREMQQEISTLIERLDQPTELAQRMEIVQLKKAKAQTVADALQNLVKAQQSKGGGQSSFSVTPDSRTNSLIVFAPPDLMTTVQDFVRRMDTTQIGEVMALRVFRLENAEAEAMSKLLQDFFKEAGTSQGKDLKQLIIRFSPVNPATGQPVLEPATGERVMQTLVHQDITIRPDTYTNSLLVLAPNESIDMMEMLVRMLDSIEPRTSKVQDFTLHNADAEEMRKLLQDLFKSTGGTSGKGGRSLMLAGAEGGAMAISGGGTADGTTGGGGEAEMLFSVDRRTNTLVAAGTPPQLKIVESLIYRLDDQEGDERIVRVVPLRYAASADVAQTMSAFFKSESAVVKTAEQGAAAAIDLRRQVTIESSPKDSNTNTLLISYSPQLESQIVKMINELDRPPPQVMIQVLMAEVTLDDRFEMGMEFAIQDLMFSENATVGNNGVIQGSGFDFIGGTDLGAAGSGLGGVSFSITGEDFNYLVRALQVEGRLEVLSRPSLFVQDNKEASINVGESVPVVTDLAVSGTGIVTPAVTYKDVGVKLEVTPVINPDGFVNLKIMPEISALGVSSVSIGAGVTLPIFTQRKAETNVTVKDGETIVIGGLITSRTSESENKVPVVGDIPIVGLAFRATVRTQSKTELLMVLTPHVVRDPDEARTMSVQMRDQTGLMEDVRTSPLMQGLQIKPDDDQLGPEEKDRGKPKPGEKQEDEMGPNVQEMGPPTTSIEFGPDRNSLAIAR